MFRSRLLQVSLLLACGITAAADPSPEIRYLTREPASMLDVGLDRLRDSIEGLLRFNEHDLGLKMLPSVHTTYDFERNQIEIIVTASQPDFPTPRDTCRALVEGVQTWMNSTKAWEAGFTHSGYTQNSQEDAAVASKLPSLVVINGVVISEKPERMLADSAMCSATMFSGVTFTESSPANKK